MTIKASPRPWRVRDGYWIVDANSEFITAETDEPTAHLIVLAVNHFEEMRDMLEDGVLPMDIQWLIEWEGRTKQLLSKLKEAEDE